MQINDAVKETNKLMRTIMDTNESLSEENARLRLVAVLLYNFTKGVVDAEDGGCDVCAYCPNPEDYGSFKCNAEKEAPSYVDFIPNYCIPGILTKLMGLGYWDYDDLDKLSLSMSKVEDKLKVRMGQLGRDLRRELHAAERPTES